jgi:ParB family chromosome partitioning protein
MEVKELDVSKLIVSELNVRKTLTSDEDETGISDLANDIRTNGLINPITVRSLGDKYEIIAGQRRFLACKLLNRKTISCSIVNVTTQKAEELSLVENVQRNPMTNSDKVKTYNKLYNVYNKDIDKVISVVNISRTTLNKYLKLSSLPEEVIRMLDSNSDEKITLDVAVELTKLPETVNKLDAIKHIQSLTTTQQKSALRQFVLDECTDVNDLKDIKQDIAIQQNQIILAPAFPYVKDSTGKHIKIPESLYDDVILLIQNRTGTLEYV